ncbi:MAG TPA: chemotaxis protein CheB [Cyclobacteriaceae bacterium]|nr:chemotaxis protein CheB [Cyclobacteriaceae bacterium]
MAEGKLIVIGGSAGSLSPVLKIASLFHKGMDICVLIVMHRAPSDESVLPEVLVTKTEFTVKEVDDKDELKPGMLYIAPPDYHVLIERDCCLTLDDSEKVHFSRPSIDVTFESAAEVYGSSLVCVLLSGANADGVAGLEKAKEKGAVVIIQDPEVADFAFMPQKALEQVKPDMILSENNFARLTDYL